MEDLIVHTAETEASAQLKIDSIKREVEYIIKKLSAWRGKLWCDGGTYPLELGGTLERLKFLVEIINGTAAPFTSEAVPKVDNDQVNNTFTVDDNTLTAEGTAEGNATPVTEACE
jgi:hypothetical protein